MASRVLYRAIWVPSALALLALTVLFSRQTTALPTPGKLAPYVSGDQVIHIAHPANWKPDASSNHGVETIVSFAPARGVLFSVTTDLQGSLMADISKATGGVDLPSNLPGMDLGGGNGPPPAAQSPLEKLHALQGRNVGSAKEFLHFQDGTTAPAQVAGLEALATDFTCELPGLWSPTPMVGKRFTALSGDRRVSVIYACPKDRQAELTPIFTQMLQTLQIGQGGS
ncbi:MAG TPA: hypothetical protein VKT32_14575 [Chthonomonadaceae bacterium]|nr:hypothetical protein [Chthonomonadaceae bacterium]